MERRDGERMIEQKEEREREKKTRGRKASRKGQ